MTGRGGATPVRATSAACCSDVSFVPNLLGVDMMLSVRHVRCGEPVDKVDQQYCRVKPSRLRRTKVTFEAAEFASISATSPAQRPRFLWVSQGRVGSVVVVERVRYRAQDACAGMGSCTVSWSRRSLGHQLTCRLICQVRRLASPHTRT